MKQIKLNKETAIRLGCWIVGISIAFICFDSMDTLKGKALITMFFVGAGILFDSIMFWEDEK